MRINLTKKQIVNSIYMQIGFSKKISESLLEDFFQIILKNLISNKKVNERIGRNPKTKEVKIISSRKVVLFKPSKELKNYINND